MAEEETKKTQNSKEKSKEQQGEVNTEVSGEMKKAYLDYAMSVIVSRAIPSIEDGLKPVQRRILYSMYLMGLKPNTQTKKSARIVGDVIGKYHPHGDSAVYDAMVRMAQDFSLRYPLVFGQGNFGCFTGKTKVKLTDGRNLSFIDLIKEHKKGKRNFTYTVNNEGVIEVAEIRNPRKTKENEKIMNVVLDNGEKIQCTLDHKFMLRDGSYKEARKLSPGESLMPYYSKLSTSKDSPKAPKTVGYEMIFQPSKNLWDFAHILSDKWNLDNGVYNKSQGRIRHHIDFDKFNNNPENIQRINWKDHWKIHHNFTSQKHKNDKNYRKKLEEGRNKFWSNPSNREKYSKRMRNRNLENWKRPSYRKRMKKFLSEVNKEYLKNNPEKIEEMRERASNTMKKMWQNPSYRNLFNKKIVQANKKRKTNNTGKKKFLKICKYLIDNNLKINKKNYEKVRKDSFGIKSFTSWDLGIRKYFNNDKNLALCELNGNHKVERVEFLNEHTDVYDLEVPGTHNFALASGVFVHNSVDGDPPAAYRYCVTGDSLVLSDKGIIPISSISSKSEEKIDMKILSYNGKKNKAVKFFNSGKHKTIKITTKSGFELEGSYNHPVMTWTFGEDFKPQVKWKLLEEVKENEVVLINRNHNLFSKNSFDLKEHFPEKGFRNEVSLPSKMNSELAFLLGALVSEGSIHQKQILFNNKDSVFYNKIKSILKSQFKNVKLYERNIKGGCKELSIYEQKIVSFLKNIGLTFKSREKNIPFSVLQSKKEHVKEFLKALFEGDGCVQLLTDKRHGGQNMNVSYDSNSQSLIKQLKIVLLNFGIISNVPSIDKRSNCGKLYLTGVENISQFKKEIGFFSDKKNTKLKEIENINKGRLSKFDFVPFLNLYLRKKYKKEFISKNNFDRYNSLSKNYERLISIVDKEDKKLIDWILKSRFYFDQLTNVEKTNKKKNVYSVKVDSNCHSFIGNGFVNHNTEAKLKPISLELLQDIEKETVEFLPNFDNSLKEPSLLPGKLPNLMINGASGIAVGMATNIPPHNLSEVCDAINAYIKNPNMSVEQLNEIIQGPDFPTGGGVYGEMNELYKNGRGKLTLKGKVTTENLKRKQAVVITEIPYMLNKSTLVEQIANLAKDKKIRNVADIRDESAKGKIRIVIELKQGTDPKFVINSLYKYTRLQDSFHVNMLALVKGQPRVLNLKQIIENYIEYRKKVITKRSKFELKKAKNRKEIVEGLLKALENINDIISTIRKSKAAKEAMEALMKDFSLTERQAKAILDTKLQQLTSMEKDKLNKEHKELTEKIGKLEEILGDIKEVLKLISKDVNELKKSYGTPRKTQLLKKVKNISEKDLIQDKNVVVNITDKGYVKRMDIKTYKEQRRGGSGVIGSSLTTGDFVKQLITCSTHDYLMFFTSRGRVLWLKAYNIPAAERQSKGRALVNMLNLREETITKVISVKNFDDFLFMATKKGVVKKISLNKFSKPRASGVRAINLPKDNSDNLIGVNVIKKGQEVFLGTKKGRAIRFNSEDVREMGRTSYGVRGISLNNDGKEKDEVVSLEVLDTKELLTITEKGQGKRTAVEDYRKTARGGKGVINIKTSDKTGDVVKVEAVQGDDSIIITTAKGMVVRTSLKNIRVMGRAAQGVRIVRLQPGDKVTDLVNVARRNEMGDDGKGPEDSDEDNIENSD